MAGQGNKDTNRNEVRPAAPALLQTKNVFLEFHLLIHRHLTAIIHFSLKFKYLRIMKKKVKSLNLNYLLNFSPVFKRYTPNLSV